MSNERAHGKHFLGPIAFGYGLLISPTCDMVDQRTLEQSHPYRVFVPVVTLSMIEEGAPGARGNIGLIWGRDTVIPYMFLPHRSRTRRCEPHGEGRTQHGPVGKSEIVESIG